MNSARSYWNNDDAMCNNIMPTPTVAATHSKNVSRLSGSQPTSDDVSSRLFVTRL